MMRRILGFILGGIAVLLPHRARVVFVEGLGWAMQGLFWLFRVLLEFIVRQLRPSPAGGPAGSERSAEGRHRA